MNADKQDKNQRLRMAQSLYRKRKYKNVKRDSKIWTIFIVIAVLVSLLFLIINELYFIDRGFPSPSELISKIAATFNRVF
jgi:Trk-type K+ transport system membrane component